MATFYADYFRSAIIVHALRGECSLVPLPDRNTYCIKGAMLIDGSSPKYATADVTIIFSVNNWNIIPPEVTTDVKWLQPRHGKSISEYADWHRYPDGRLCWTRPDCWEQVCKDISNPLLIERAAVVLAKDVSFLLRCHLTADIYGIRKWPHEWDAWPHGGK